MRFVRKTGTFHRPTIILMRSHRQSLVYRFRFAGFAALLLVAWHAGRSGSLLEGALVAAAFVMATFAMLASRRRFEGRVTMLVDLFSRAEQGDFTGELPASAEEPQDWLASLGRAYDHLRRELAPLVLRDPLTGCLNRRGFEQELARATARASRQGSDLALLAIDVDHFKRTNDGYGHLVGDLVLREVGALLLRAARAGDVVARLGGDEFVLTLPETDGEEAGVVAERITDAVRRHVFRTSRGEVRVTLSVGIAAEQVLQSGIDASLRARADEAMYVAKRLGRDRVVLWAPGIRSRTTPPYVPLADVADRHHGSDAHRSR